MGVDAGQGFFLGKPEPLDGFLAKLSSSGSAEPRRIKRVAQGLEPVGFRETNIRPAA
jgi:hypothetical protein